MFIDPEAALPFEDVLALVWKRDPEMHRRVVVIAERTGRSVEEIAREARAWMVRMLETDSPEREQFFQDCDRVWCPLWSDPLLHDEGEE